MRQTVLPPNVQTSVNPPAPEVTMSNVQPGVRTTGGSSIQTSDPGWVGFAIHLIADAEAVEKQNQILLDELAATITKLDDILRSLSLHTPFINTTRIVGPAN
jgi:hypothetical protein